VLNESPWIAISSNSGNGLQNKQPTSLAPSDAGDGRSGDSAESCAAGQGPRDAGNPPPSAPLDAGDGRVDDSAESLNETEPTSGCGQSVLHQRADAAKRGFHRADALVSVAQGYLRGDRPQHSPIEVTVTIPQSGLRADLIDPTEVGEMGESFVSAEAARRLSCDAGVVEVVEDEHGTPLSVGRKRRTIAGALKRALHKRDRICTYPGCAHRIFLAGHYIKHWADGGETSLNNLALLCSLHHRHVHEYGYTIATSCIRSRSRSTCIGRFRSPTCGWYPNGGHTPVFGGAAAPFVAIALPFLRGEWR